jgi:hypothetical protein
MVPTEANLLADREIVIQANESVILTHHWRLDDAARHRLFAA